MNLSKDLISQFVKATKDTTTVKKESTVYGTVVKYNEKTYVKIDGSDLLTPAETLSSVEEGERVSIMIKDHTATITGNYTAPSASSIKVDGMDADLKANTASIKNLVAKNAEIENLVATKATIEDLRAANAEIDTLKADYAEIETLVADKASIGDLAAVNADIKSLKADKADIAHLEANYATIGSLNAVYADVTRLEADKANITDLEATNAKIDNLEANKADIEFLQANYATIQQLDATNANVTNLQTETANINTALIDKANVSDLNATNANVTNLQATKADVTELNAAKANITTLTSDLADITTLVNGNLTSDNIQSMVITGDKFTVADAFIKDAMIDSINANKINTGTINTNNVSIQSNDGSMILQGNLQQFKDENGNVRIQIGKDTSGNFTFVLYDENGTGQLINQNGIQSSDAIADGLIVDAKVADNANIAGSKLDIDSVVTEVNNGTTNIKGTKIYLDDQNQTLNVAFNNMSTTVSGNTSTLESHTTSINTMNGEITQLISDTTITKQDGTTVSLKDAYNSTVDTVNSHTQTIGSLETNLNKVSTGQNKWLLEMFEKGDGIDAESPITIKDIMGKTLIKAILVEDSVTNNQSQFGNQYLGRATTYVYLDEDYNWETTATSDDGSTIYINGVAIATLRSCTPTAVTVPFKQGWNKITWVYNEGVGGDGWDFNPRLTTLSQVKYMNAYPMTNVDEVGNTLDGDIKTVSSKQTALEQNLDGFKQTVSETYATKTSVTDLSNNLTNNYSTTTAMNSAIDQKANEITSSVSETYATKYEFNNLNVGGRNFVINSGFKGSIPDTQNTPYWNYWGNVLVFYDQGKENYNAINTLYLRNHTTNGGGIYQDISSNKIPKNTQITISYDMSRECNVINSYTVLEFYDTGLNRIDTIEVADAVGHVVRTVTTSNSDYSIMRLVIAHAGSNSDVGGYLVAIGNVKIEKGNKATDWTPAPEDIDNTITVVDNKFVNYSTTQQMNSAIDQKANEITSSVSQTYATKTSVTDLNNNLVNNYSTTAAMNSAINQKANEINLNVSNTYATKTSVNDLNNNLINNYSTTQQMNSSIEQKANEITSSVSSMYSTKTETDDKIHNVRVGGTNLFRGTTNLDSLYWSGERAWLADSYYKGSRIYRTGNAWADYNYPVRQLFEDAVIELWTEYTFSCYARSNTEDYKPDLCIYGDSAHMEGHGLYIGTVTTEWRQYSGKIKIYDGDRSYPLRIEPTTGSGDANKYIEVCGLQLEKGNKATDWSPSPRDTDVVNPNLIKNGRFKSIQPNAVDNVPDWIGLGGVTVWTSIGQPGYDRYGCIYFHKASCDGGGCYLCQDLNLDDIGRNVPLTLSFDAWREGTISEVGCNVEYFNADKSSMLASKSLNANDFNGHRSYTFVTNNDVNMKYLRVVFYYISANGATGEYLATIGNVKLEHGLCETAWSQSEYENMYAYYTTKSELQQTTNSITAKFSESGGYNLLRNSRALKGTSYWTDNGGGISVDGGNPPTIDHKYFCTNFPGGITYYDWIQLENNTHYIYSAKIYVAEPITFNGIVPLHHWCTGDKTPGQTKLSIVRCSHDGQTIPAGQWIDVWVEYLTASSGAVWFKPFIYKDGSSCAISVTDLMLCKGSIPSPWSPHPSEVYDGITQIDKDGIKVYHNNIDGDNYTHMAPTGFYLKNKGEDVFKVDAAGLYLKGNVHITNGSVPSNLLNGQISDGLIGEWIRNGATNGSNAKSTLDNNAGNWNATTERVNGSSAAWDNAYNRVVDWAYGSVGGRTTINGGLLQTNTVTTQHLAIGDFNNYSQLVPGHNLSNRYGYVNWSGGGDHFFWGCPGDSQYLPFTINETVNPFKQGDKVGFKFEAYAQVDLDVAIGVYFYSDDYASAYMTERTTAVHIYPGWNGYSAQVSIDCNETKWARSVAIMIYKGADKYLEVRNVVIARMTGNVMIEDGAITASKISAGAVTADKISVTDLSALNASIGGFSMYSGKLVGTGGNGVGMSGNGDDWAFWAGSNTGGNAPFHVGHEGNLYATQAYITGTITSSTINGGTINGGVINGSVVNSDSFIGDLLAIDGTISAKSLQVQDIDNAKYPGAVTADFKLYVSTSGNDDSEIENGATFATFDGLLDKLPKNLNGHEVRIEMSTDITENVDFKGFHGGKIRLYMKGHTLYGYLVSRMGSARINVNSGYIGNASDTSNGWGKIHPSKGYAVSSYTTTVASVDQGAIGLYNIDVYGADNYLSGSTTKLGVAGQDWGTAYLNGVSYYGCDMGARANAGGRIHDVLSYNVCTKYGFYATTGGYITLAGDAHSGGKSKNYHEADGGKVIVASGATFASGEASVPGGSAPIVPTTKTITIKSTYGDTYRSSVYNSWKKDGTARQGDYGYGDCNGCWFFGDAFSDLEGKTINKVTIKITRQSGGSSSAVGLVVKSHGHSGRPSGAPSYRTTAGTLSLATGASGTLTITNSTILSEISSGAVKGFGIQSTYNSSNYAVCSGSVTVKITYTE